MRPLKDSIKLIAVTGSARCGKNTLVNALQVSCGYTPISFAEPIYKMLNTLPQLVDLNSESPTTRKETGIVFYNGKSPRKMLQTLGTEWGRHCMSEDFWINILEYRIFRSMLTAFAISDLRFENEAEWVRRNGGLVVHMSRDGIIPVSKHISEDGIVFREGDHYIYNNGTIEQLRLAALPLNELAEARRSAAQAAT